MFEQNFPTGAGKTRRAWTVGAGFAGQLLAVSVAVLIPLVFTDKLPSARLAPFRMEAPPPAPRHQPARKRSVQVVAVVRETRSGQVFAPASFPARPLIIVEPALPAAPDLEPDRDGVFSGDPAASPGPVMRAMLVAVPAPPEGVEVAAPPAPALLPIRIRVGGMVQAAKLVVKIAPRYPPLAIQARIAGTVRLLAIIGRDGRIRELRATSGHPLLAPAALEAVRQWSYQPTLLNGETVEVATEIEVTFTLGSLP